MMYLGNLNLAIYFIFYCLLYIFIEIQIYFAVINDDDSNVYIITQNLIKYKYKIYLSGFIRKCITYFLESI